MTQDQPALRAAPLPPTTPRVEELRKEIMWAYKAWSLPSKGMASIGIALIIAGISLIKRTRPFGMVGDRGTSSDVPVGSVSEEKDVG